MAKKMIKCIAVLLICTVLLSGCGVINGLLAGRLVPYDQMQYARPNMIAFAAVLDKSCNYALEGEDIDVLVNAIWDFYDVYDSFYTNLNLAFIAYSRDLTDIYWEEEYAYCSAQAATADAGLDRLYRSLAKSPLRHILEGEDYFGADYFDSFEGETVYDEQFVQMLNREAELCNQYQVISGEAADSTYYSEEYFTRHGSRMAEVFLQLVQLRQEMTAYLGYDSYPQLAYDLYHIRDYTPQEATAYLADVRAELVPLYSSILAEPRQELQYCTESDTFGYVRSMAKNMGGIIADAFSDMSRAGVYDITISDRKYNTSYETYLSSYYTPYIFFCPTATEYDKLTFAHEFAHFCADYASAGGSMLGVDASEVFSQAMEYLSLEYAEEADALLELKMTDSLCVFVEQAALASFEHQVYSLRGAELTVEGMEALYEEIFTAYGLNVEGWDSRDYVCVPHFYQSPMYIISYVLSNDAALQIYEMELQEKGSGLACFEANLTSAQPYFLAFLEEAGLSSPFATGRLAQVRKTLETALKTSS